MLVKGTAVGAMQAVKFHMKIVSILVRISNDLNQITMEMSRHGMVKCWYQRLGKVIKSHRYFSLSLLLASGTIHLMSNTMVIYSTRVIWDYFGVECIASVR